MEPAIAGALYAAESIVEGALAFAKGIAHPTLPLHASFTHITSTPLPRSGHTLSVVKGRAYIFGGESEPGTLADNDIHVVILPSSGVLEADYKSIPARSTSAGGQVPSPRKGHSAAVIGDSIYIFGGEGPQPENGRVWVFDTVSNTWSHLDPVEGASFPAHRSGHASASSELPAPKETTFRETAPQQPADPAQVVPEPATGASWGTVFIVGGKKIDDGELLNDGLAFDVRTRTWSNIPKPLGEPREGASLVLVGSRLYRYGGKGLTGLTDGGVEWVDVSNVWKHAEDGTTALKSGWAWEEIKFPDGNSPNARSGAGLVNVTTGQGRHYLLTVGGEGQAGAVYDDAWAFQLPPESSTAAAIKDSTRSAIKKDTKEGKWDEVKYKYVDTTGEEKPDVPGETQVKGTGPRAHFAAAKGTEVDGASVVIWGGVDSQGKILSDGWLVTVER